MEFMQWNDDLSVGVQVLDQEHKNLLDFINRLNNALQIGDTKKTMEDILGGLIKYIDIHFTHEEAMMRENGYPHYDSHRKEHIDLTSQVVDFHRRLQQGKSSFSLELMHFLRDWLLNHIQKRDKAYREFFNERGVH